MPLQVKCPNPACRGVSVIDDKVVGADTRCKACGMTFHVAAPQTAAPRPAASTILPAAAAKQTQDGGGASPSVSAKPPATSGSSKRIGRFEIRARLGAGAFGVVYRAFDPQLKREVALKVLHPEMLKHPDRVARFQREAQSAAQLRHANIVPVFDIGQDGGQYYIASAYIPGQTLHDALDDQPMPFQRAARIVRDLADAVGYAHQQGVVHRDLKPANILLDEKDAPQLVDFGLSARQEETTQDRTSRLTRLGAVLGTPAYMAPEQASGQTGEVQPAADQYSLGIILYELLCGHPPFEGPPELVLYNVLHKEPATPRSVNASVPPELELICLKAIARRPEDRYANCQALADALRRWLENSNTLVPAVNKEATPVRAVNKEATPVRAVRNERTSVEARKALLARQTLIPAAKPSTTKKWLIVAGAAGVAFLALFVLIGLVGLWKSGVFKVKTKDGTIVLENLPPDADVTVDGEKVVVKPGMGKTFEVRVDASKKIHRVEIKKDGFKVFGDEVEVEVGGRKAVLVRLEPMPPPIPTEKTKDGTIVLENLPADADVTVDGKEVPVMPGDGKTFEVHVDASKKKHRLEVKKHGFKDFGDEVEVDAGGRKSVVVRLEPIQPPGEDKDKWVSLFNGKDLTGWTTLNGQPANWAVRNGYVEVTRGTGDIMTKEKFGPDFKLHVEFWLPLMPQAKGQGRANSGVFLQGRYEVQILDSFMNDTFAGGSIGSLFGLIAPDAEALKKAIRPPEQWQTYDIDFQAPRVNEQGKVTEKGRITLVLNDVTVIKDGQFDKTSGGTLDNNLGAPGPIRLQDHGATVRFRKIEIKDLATAKPDGQGFVPLFNGKDLTGWKTHPKQPGNWRIKDGFLIGSGPSVTSHLYTERGDYKDFHLRLEARINDGGNSGVYFRTPFGPTRPANQPRWLNGYNAKIDKDRLGGFLLDDPSENVPLVRSHDPAIPAGQWLTLEVIVQGNRIVVKTDGITTAEYTDEKRCFTSGHIALQQHTPQTVVEFRKIEIKELPPGK